MAAKSSTTSALPPKAYFRIGEVAELVGVEPHVLRYWEREFRNIRPTKSAKGQRVYSRRDVEKLMRVRDLLYREGFTIAGAKKKLRDSEPPPAGDDEPASGAALDDGLGAPPAVAEAPAPAPAASVPERSVRPRIRPTREDLLAMREEIRAWLSELDSERR